MIAYDYDAQRWTHGEEGRAARIKQLTDERAIIAGPGGQAFLDWTHQRGSAWIMAADALAEIDRELAQLRRTETERLRRAATVVVVNLAIGG
jgi:hypothetical protein